ncbi:hypothetical protein [Streptomyces sp. NPDC058280]|uniref:hypothetical protein n=1 Tax=Streptomyces sp. NPDC058280 TaxID=3346419 RepID=UPI0036DFF985
MARALLRHGAAPDRHGRPLRHLAPARRRGRAARPGPEPIRVVLADRAAWDALAYFHAAEEWRRAPVNRLERERLRLLASTRHPKYDLLLATVLDQALPVEQKYDAHYRYLVDQYTHLLLAKDEIPHQRVTSDPDSQARAVERALQLCLKKEPAV